MQTVICPILAVRHTLARAVRPVLLVHAGGCAHGDTGPRPAAFWQRADLPFRDVRVEATVVAAAKGPDGNCSNLDPVTGRELWQLPGTNALSGRRLLGELLRTSEYSNADT